MYCIYKWFTAISLSIFNFHFWSIFWQRPDRREVDKDDYWNDRSSDQTPWAGRPVLWNEHDDKRSGRQNQLDVSLVLGSRRAFIWNKEKYRKCIGFGKLFISYHLFLPSDMRNFSNMGFIVTEVKEDRSSCSSSQYVKHLKYKYEYRNKYRNKYKYRLKRRVCGVE